MGLQTIAPDVPVVVSNAYAKAHASMFVKASFSKGLLAICAVGYRTLLARAGVRKAPAPEATEILRVIGSERASPGVVFLALVIYFDITRNVGG